MKKSFALSSLSIALMALAGSANAVDFKAGDTTVSVGGFVNAYYTYADCSGDQGVGGIALARADLGCAGKEESHLIGNGLLPNMLLVSMKTTQAGFDIGATIGIGSAVSSATAVGQNSAVDVRQGFATFGTTSLGTIKFGRDYGYYGKNAILSDMTLLGAGVPAAAVQRNRVTLGHIGAGYTYLGTYGMISYTTPDLAGFSATVAGVSPVDDGGPAHDSLQWQALLEYKLGTLGKVWGAAKYQRFGAVAGSPGTPATFDPVTGIFDPGVTGVTGSVPFNTEAYEIGGSLNIAGFGLLLNYQGGKALGILADGDSGDNDQQNILGQVTFNITPAIKLGLSYGQSELDDGSGSDLESNKNLTFGVYYSLTPSLTLVGEIGQTESEAFNGDKAKLKGFAVGAILFF